MKGDLHKFFSRYSSPLEISEAQRNFLISGTYQILSAFGTCLFRKLQIIGCNPYSGDVLVRETYSGSSCYKKLFVLSPDGKTEKYKGQQFSKV